jgi:hypothetical protein
MAARRFAWVLNLDADLELAAAQAYTPKRTVREAMQPFVALLASSLLAPDDVLVDESTEPLSARGLVGRAFCPTPRALAVLRRAGAEPEPHPSLDVLRRVNSRAFASSLGTTLPGAAFVTTLAAARAKLAETPPVGDGWRLKRNFGMTGRGQRVIAPNAAGDADLAFLRAGLGEGGIQIEPNVVLGTEYAMHGMLAADGSWQLGALVKQRCDSRGAWISTEPVGAPSAEETGIASKLGAEAGRVATALAAAGYFGPFGIDAYTYRGANGNFDIQLRSEINARYSMGFATGLGIRGVREERGSVT